jgi:flagellar biogenesis protein FliO
MKKIPAVALIFFLLSLAAVSLAANKGETTQASDNAETVSSAIMEDRGAGYLPYSEPTPLGSGGLFGAILRTMFSLAIVLGLIYATLWLIRRFTGSSMDPFFEGPVRVVGRVYLSPKVVVHFLRLGDELLVIGAGAGGISLLTTIRDERQIAQIEHALKGVRTHVPKLAFSRFFDRSLARFQKALEKEDTPFDDQLRLLNEQIGRLRGLARKRQRDED